MLKVAPIHIVTSYVRGAAALDLNAPVVDRDGALVKDARICEARLPGDFEEIIDVQRPSNAFAPDDLSWQVNLLLHHWIGPATVAHDANPRHGASERRERFTVQGQQDMQPPTTTGQHGLWDVAPCPAARLQARVGLHILHAGSSNVNEIP